MNDSKRPRITIDVAANIENEVRRALRPFDEMSPADLQENVVRLPTGEQAVDPAPDLGPMAAEAVLKQYETTARRVEEMGEEVKARIAKLAASMQEADRDLEVLGKAAEAIQAKGKAVSDMIEVASNMSKLIRDACADFQNKVGNGEA